MQEYKFDGDFLRWLAGQSPQFLDFMFRYYREMLQLEAQGVYARLPEASTGQRIIIRFARTEEELKAAAQEILSVHDPEAQKRVDFFDRMAKKGPISADEIADFHRSLG